LQNIIWHKISDSMERNVWQCTFGKR
jgi:hypothetical protein